MHAIMLSLIHSCIASFFIYVLSSLLRLIYSFVQSCIYSLMHPSFHSFTHSFIRSFIHSFIHSFIPLFVFPNPSKFLCSVTAFIMMLCVPCGLNGFHSVDVFDSGFMRCCQRRKRELGRGSLAISRSAKTRTRKSFRSVWPNPLNSGPSRQWDSNPKK